MRWRACSADGIEVPSDHHAVAAVGQGKLSIGGEADEIALHEVVEGGNVEENAILRIGGNWYCRPR